MKIICPNCNTTNRINEKHLIRCGQCEQNFPDETYAKRSWLRKHPKKTIVTLIIAGAVIGYEVEDRLDENRYPLRLEYQIIANCSSNQATNRANACICALENTMKKLTYQQINHSISEFEALFRLNLNRCS